MNQHIGEPAVPEPAWLQCLRERARRLEELPDLERRRTDLVESVADRSGVSVAILEDAYDLALQEGLDPVLALELIGCGAAVLDLEGPEPDDSALSLTPPVWVDPPAEPEIEQVREKRVRLTYRRMRRILEQAPDLERAILDFAAEPDVGGYTYDPREG